MFPEREKKRRHCEKKIECGVRHAEFKCCDMFIHMEISGNS